MTLINLQAMNSADFKIIEETLQEIEEEEYINFIK